MFWILYRRETEKFSRKLVILISSLAKKQNLLVAQQTQWFRN